MNAFIYSIKDTSKTPIIYLSNSQDVYEFCNKNNINLTALINPDEDNSAIDNVTYYLENFDFAINIFDICSQKLIDYLSNTYWLFKDIVDFIKVSHKISEFELFISILYYSEGYIKDICKDYPKAIRKYIGNIENYKTINAKKDLIQIIFGERINNSELLTYIDIDTILDDLHTIEFEDKIYLFNPKQ